MDNISFFDGNQKFKIDKPIRLIELFGGYGSQHFALEYLGANFEQWKLCEWAVACKETGRQFIGFEIEPKWVKVANDRLNKTDANGQISMILR